MQSKYLPQSTTTIIYSTNQMVKNCLVVTAFFLLRVKRTLKEHPFSSHNNRFCSHHHHHSQDNQIKLKDNQNEQLKQRFINNYSNRSLVIYDRIAILKHQLQHHLNNHCKSICLLNKCRK